MKVEPWSFHPYPPPSPLPGDPKKPCLNGAIKWLTPHRDVFIIVSVYLSHLMNWIGSWYLFSRWTCYKWDIKLALLCFINFFVSNMSRSSPSNLILLMQKFYNFRAIIDVACIFSPAIFTSATCPTALLKNNYNYMQVKYFRSMEYNQRHRLCRRLSLTLQRCTWK